MRLSIRGDTSTASAVSNLNFSSAVSLVLTCAVIHHETQSPIQSLLSRRPTPISKHTPVFDQNIYQFFCLYYSKYYLPVTCLPSELCLFLRRMFELLHSFEIQLLQSELNLMMLLTSSRKLMTHFVCQVHVQLYINSTEVKKS